MCSSDLSSLRRRGGSCRRAAKVPHQGGPRALIMVYLNKNFRLSSNTRRKFGRHIFKKFYVKKTIFTNISCQKKQQISLQLNNIIILRPLLKFSRFKLLKFCEFWYLPIIPDFTNFNVCFRRNNLRLQFIPYLKIFLNLNLFKKIDQFQQKLNLENQYLQLFLQKIAKAPLYRKNNFFYFPKNFQHLILHHFYYLINKKISFNEIYCIFQKLKQK